MKICRCKTFWKALAQGGVHNLWHSRASTPTATVSTAVVLRCTEVEARYCRYLIRAVLGVIDREEFYAANYKRQRNSPGKKSILGGSPEETYRKYGNDSRGIDAYARSSGASRSNSRGTYHGDDYLDTRDARESIAQVPSTVAAQ